MKKAYLFGAAALLILLIVVAYIASNRQKEEAVCELPPPQVVGPTAAPLVLVNDGPQNVARQLFADDEFMTDEELNERLERLRGPQLTRQGLVTITDDELLDFRRTDVDAEGGALLLPPPDEDEMMREIRDSLRKTPIGGPSPIPSLLQSDICPLPFSPLTPYASYEPGEETEESIWLASERTWIDTSMSDAERDDAMNWSIRQQKRRRLDDHLYFLQQQREMMLTLPASSPLRRSFFREELLSASQSRIPRLIDLSTAEPIDNPDLLDLFLQGR